METPRLLFVHAHPDDETLTTGATIAHYVARGARVQVVTCTLGEEGEVIGERWAHLAVDDADQLGGYRIGELTAALRALGVDEPPFLGGAGRWRDSGMEGTPPRHHQRFVDADPAEPSAPWSPIIRELRPHVVVTYDPNGGYGHPDHIHAHEVTMAAVAAAAGTEYPGEPWTVPKVYWTVMARSAMAAGLDALDDVPAEWMRVSVDDVPFGYPDDAIDAVIDVPDQLPAKVAALRAHATQVTVAPDGRACALSNNIALPIGALEHYVLVAGDAGRPRRPRLGNRSAGGPEPRIARARRGKLPDNRRRVEGMTMDPDLDPNLQHWQDRLDNFQWVVGSIAGVARQHPDLSSPAPNADSSALRRSDAARGRRRPLRDRSAAFFLPTHIGPWPFPISALIGGLVNAALVWAALQWTSSPRTGGAAAVDLAADRGGADAGRARRRHRVRRRRDHGVRAAAAHRARHAAARGGAVASP